MTAPVSDSSPSSLQEERESLDPIVKPTLGIASIPDSIEVHPEAPKPNLLRRAAIHAGLLFFHMEIWAIQSIYWILTTLFGYEKRQQMIYSKLRALCEEMDVKKIDHFLSEHSKGGFLYESLFSELIRLPKLYQHLPEILKGANVCLAKDGGFFCRKWSRHPNASPRISSHAYQGTQCYAIGHFLFWLDLDGNTRFQFERSPLRGLLGAVNHWMDFLRYQRDNEQQGPSGTSRHTEAYCLKLEMDLQACAENVDATYTDSFGSG